MHWRIERLKQTDHLNGMCHKTSLTNAVLTHFLGTYSVLTIGARRKVRKTQNKKFAFHNHQSHTEAGASSHHCEFFPQLSPESRIFQDQKTVLGHRIGVSGKSKSEPNTWHTKQLSLPVLAGRVRENSYCVYLWSFPVCIRGSFMILDNSCLTPESGSEKQAELRRVTRSESFIIVKLSLSSNSQCFHFPPPTTSFKLISF